MPSEPVKRLTSEELTELEVHITSEPEAKMTAIGLNTLSALLATARREARYAEALERIATNPRMGIHSVGLSKEGLMQHARDALQEPGFDLPARYLALAARKPSLAVPGLEYAHGRWWKGTEGRDADAAANAITCCLLEAALDKGYFPVRLRGVSEPILPVIVAYAMVADLSHAAVFHPTLLEALILFHENQP